MSRDNDSILHLCKYCFSDLNRLILYNTRRKKTKSPPHKNRTRKNIDYVDQ